jgi:hypothetical protein
MNQVSISTALLNTIVQYLANRPYIEVNGIIERIQAELKQNAEENRQETWKDGSNKDSEGS